MFEIKIENLSTKEVKDFNCINEAFWYYEEAQDNDQEISVEDILVYGTSFEASTEQLEMWYDSSADETEAHCMVWLVDNHHCDNCHDSAYDYMNSNCYRFEAHSEEEAFKEYLETTNWLGGVDEKIMYYVDIEKVIHDFRYEGTYINHIGNDCYIVINS